MATTGDPAIVAVGDGSVVLRDVPSPDLGPHDVRIRTHYSGVSTGTDRWVLNGKYVWSDLQYPAVPGYQATGTVEAVGADVDSYRIGERVFVTIGRRSLHFDSGWGAHASVIVSSVDEVYRLVGVSPLRGAFTVVGQVGFNAASRLLLDSDPRVAVIGDGIIGSSAAIAARERGFRVLVVGHHRGRLEVLERLGFETLDSQLSSADAISLFAPGAVIDTVQNVVAGAMYLPALPRGGQVVYSGHSPGGITVWADMAELQKREISAHFISGWTRSRIEATLGLMRGGEMPLDLLVGEVADNARSATALMNTVAAGRLRPIAAAIDWSWAT